MLSVGIIYNVQVPNYENRSDSWCEDLKRIERNKGSHGVDEMLVQNLRMHIVKR